MKKTTPENTDPTPETDPEPDLKKELDRLIQTVRLRRFSEPDQVLLLAAIGGWQGTKKEFLKAAAKLLPESRLEVALEWLLQHRVTIRWEDGSLYNDALVVDRGDRLELTDDAMKLYHSLFGIMLETHHHGLAHKASLSVATVSRWNCWLSAIFMALLAGGTTNGNKGHPLGRWQTFRDTLAYCYRLRSHRLLEKRLQLAKGAADLTPQDSKPS